MARKPKPAPINGNGRIDDVGIRYFVLNAGKKNRISNTKKRHITAGTTEKWRFWLILCLSVIILLAAQGLWHELKLLIP